MHQSINWSIHPSPSTYLSTRSSIHQPPNQSPTDSFTQQSNGTNPFFWVFWIEVDEVFLASETVKRCGTSALQTARMTHDALDITATPVHIEVVIGRTVLNASAILSHVQALWTPLTVPSINTLQTLFVTFDTALKSKLAKIYRATKF